VEKPILIKQKPLFKGGFFNEINHNLEVIISHEKP